MIESLLDQMHTVMMAADCPVNVGNDFDNILEHQRRRKLANLKDGCRKLYGLGIHSILIWCQLYFGQEHLSKISS